MLMTATQTTGQHCQRDLKHGQLFSRQTCIALQQAREAGTSRMTHADILTGEDEHANVPARTEQVVHVGARAAV